MKGGKIIKKKWITKQEDIKDCGAACLSSIIKYYDGYIDMETLREKTYTDKSGTNAYHIINAAKSIGFDACGIKCNLENIDNTPCIAHVVNDNNISHFVVIYEINYKNDSITIMDPSFGKRILNLQYFEKIWTKVIIDFYPKTKIPKLPKQPNIKNLFLKIIPTEKYFLIKILLTTIILTFITIISSFYFKVALNNIDIFNNKFSLFKISIIFLIVYIFKLILNYIKEIYEIYLNKNLDIKIVLPFLNHIFFLPLNYIKNKTVGEIVMRVEEMNNMKDLFSQVLIHLIVDLFLAIFAVVILININLKLFFILLIVLVLYIIIGVCFSPVIYKKAIKNIDYETSFKTTLVEDIGGLESIKNLNKTNSKLINLENKFITYLKDSFNFNKIIAFQNFLKNTICELGIFICLGVGFYLYILNEITIGDIVTFNSILYYLLDPIKNTIDLIPKVNYIKASFNKISDFINISEENYSLVKEEFKPGDIVFEKVGYSYNQIDYIVQNLNMTIKEKEKVMIVGKSGSGKTTLCKLLFGIDTLTKGKIKIGGINIKDYKINTIRENISYLSQNEKLFTDTIYNNISFFENISIKEIDKIAKICKIEDILDNKPLRYETLIEEEGFNFSGGEKQRIILARTLIKNASILILDEALSEVEEKVEGEIINNIISNYPEKTIIYISHRNQKKYFDKVINLNEINTL